MESIEQVVRNVFGNSERAKYDPKTSKNWCHLPLEMRMKCIREMDFLTRTRLSATSIIEKSLVGMKKYEFDEIWINSRDVTAIRRGKAEERVKLDMKKSREEKLHFTRFVLKKCEIDEFGFNDNDRTTDMINPAIDLADCVPFTFKKLNIGCSWENTKFLLENCPNLEVITTGSVFNFRNIINIPMITKVKEIRLTDCWNMGNIWKLIQKWVEADAEVWNSIQFKFYTCHGLDMFAEEFNDRIIERKQLFVRIRMDDPSKQILLRRVNAQHHDAAHYSCKVIPIDLPENEFRKGDTWIENELRKLEEEKDEDFFTSFINFGYEKGFFNLKL